MNWFARIRMTFGLTLTFTLLVVAPGCGGGGGGCKDTPLTLGGGNPLGPLPATPPALVGRATGTWQGSATDALAGQPQPNPSFAASPAGPLTVIVNRNGTFSGTLHDTATSEVGTLVGTIKNYDTGSYGLDPDKRAGYIVPGATLTFTSRSYMVSGGFVLENDGRHLTGNFVLGRSVPGPGGSTNGETSLVNFEMTKQE